jgi:hypothetical protein
MATKAPSDPAAALLALVEQIKSGCEQIKTATTQLPAAVAVAIVGAQAEHARLTREMAELHAEHAKLKAKHDEMVDMTGTQFMQHCVASGIDKHSLAELRAKIQATAGA